MIYRVYKQPAETPTPTPDRWERATPIEFRDASDAENWINIDRSVMSAENFTKFRTLSDAIEFNEQASKSRFNYLIVGRC